MQELAKSWIVIHMVGTAGAIGSLMFAAALPNIALASFGGSYADRKGARKTLHLRESTRPGDLRDRQIRFRQHLFDALQPQSADLLAG